MLLIMFITAAKVHVVEFEMDKKSTILLFQDNERITLCNADIEIAWDFLFFYDASLRIWFSN